MNHFFFIINFEKKKANSFTLLIILLVKSLQKICYYEPQSAGINVQSPQSATTHRRLTLTHLSVLMFLIEFVEYIRTLYLFLLLCILSKIPLETFILT